MRTMKIGPLVYGHSASVRALTFFRWKQSLITRPSLVATVGTTSSGAVDRLDELGPLGENNPGV
jgi:hypothetical protein